MPPINKDSFSCEDRLHVDSLSYNVRACAKQSVCKTANVVQDSSRQDVNMDNFRHFSIKSAHMVSPYFGEEAPYFAHDIWGKISLTKVVASFFNS